MECPIRILKLYDSKREQLKASAGSCTYSHVCSCLLYINTHYHRALLFSPFNFQTIHLLFLTHSQEINILCQSLFVSEDKLCVYYSSQDVDADYQPELEPHNYRTQCLCGCMY